MQDTCRIGAYTSTDNAYNLPSVTYVYGVEVVCGLDLMRPNEQHSSGEVAVIDAILRLPIGTTIDERDRVRVEQRYNEALTTPLVFEIEGPVDRGPSGIRLDLRLVDDGSGLEYGV